MTGDPERARAANRTLARARRRTLRSAEVWQDLYVVVLGTALSAVWSVSISRELLGSGTGSTSDERLMRWRAVAVALTIAGGLLLLAGGLGPISAGRATRRWLLGTTANRRVLLRPVLRSVITLAGLAGLLSGAVVYASGGGTMAPSGLLAAAGLGAATSLLVVASAAVAQTHGGTGPAQPRRTAGRRAGVLMVMLGEAVLLATTLGWRGWRTALPPPWLLWAVGIAALLAAILGTGIAQRDADRLTDGELIRGRALLDVLVGSALMLDLSGAEALSDRRRHRRRGRYRTIRGRWSGAAAFGWRDLVMTRRRWRSYVVGIAVLPLAAVAGAELGHQAAVIALILVVFLTLRVGAGGLRTWLASPALRRSVRTSPVAVTVALSLVPLLLGTALASPVVVVLGLPWWPALLAATAAVSGTIRAGTPSEVDLGLAVSTPMGVVQTGLMAGLVRGPDLAVGLGLLHLAWPSPWTLLVAGGVLAWQVGRER